MNVQEGGKIIAREAVNDDEMLFDKAEWSIEDEEQASSLMHSAAEAARRS